MITFSYCSACAVQVTNSRCYKKPLMKGPLINDQITMAISINVCLFFVFFSGLQLDELTKQKQQAVHLVLTSVLSRTPPRTQICTTVLALV